LEKAIYQVEQALKRSKSNGVAFDPDTEVDLRQLIDQSQNLAGQHNRHSSIDNAATLHPSSTLGQRFSRTDSNLGHRTSIADSLTPDHVAKPDEMAVDNADNPLQLLAMASAMPNQSPSSAITPSPAAATVAHTGDADDSELETFFGSLMPVLDNSSDIDPVELGLVTDEEAESLFT
jgi:hypothetical protein